MISAYFRSAATHTPPAEPDAVTSFAPSPRRVGAATSEAIAPSIEEHGFASIG
jgi:hypothetical protein